MLEVISLEIDTSIPDKFLPILMNLVSPEKRKRVNKLYHKQDAVNTLLGDIITRKAICTRTGKLNETLVFSFNQYGKPYLANVPDLHFNISHSGNLVVCALDVVPVGLDIEVHKSANLKIAKRFFCQDEYEFIVKSESTNEAFYNVWAKKESYVKWGGKGLSTPLNSFSILNMEGIFFHSIDIRNDASCFICSETSQISSYKKSSLSDFLHFFDVF